MNTFTKMLITMPLVASSLSGCSILEATGDIALGTLAVVGETALFITDTATFGAVSALTGMDDEGWATTPSQAASTYSAFASSYSAAAGQTSTSSSAAVLAGLNALSSSSASQSDSFGLAAGPGEPRSFSSAAGGTDAGGGSFEPDNSDLPSANGYDCESRERELTAKMQRMMGQDSGSICITARTTAPLFDEMAEFYRNCRILDPTGELASTAEYNARAMRETARQVCTN